MNKAEKNSPANKNRYSLPEVESHYRKENYMLIGGGFLAVILGFILMYVSPENAGKADVIYSNANTTIPVLIILTGFGVTAFGIMKKPKNQEKA